MLSKLGNAVRFPIAPNFSIAPKPWSGGGCPAPCSLPPNPSSGGGCAAPCSLPLFDPSRATAEPSSVEFHSNTSAYLGTLRASQAQSKSQWLMMQMSETHPERRRVRSTFGRGWGDATVQLTPESTKRLRVSEYLMALGRHRFVLSPRGNGLDAHRTWEALLVGSIPSMRRTHLQNLHLHLPSRACKCTSACTCTCMQMSKCMYMHMHMHSCTDHMHMYTARPLHTVFGRKHPQPMLD